MLEGQIYSRRITNRKRAASGNLFGDQLFYRSWQGV
jgi:hypothetical protein